MLRSPISAVFVLLTLALTWTACLAVVEVWKCGGAAAPRQCTRSANVGLLRRHLPASLVRAAVVVAVPDLTSVVSDLAVPSRCKGASPQPSTPVVEVLIVVEGGQEASGGSACHQLFGGARPGFQAAAPLLGACVDFERACSELATDLPAAALWDGGAERLRGPLAPTAATPMALSSFGGGGQGFSTSKRTALRWIGPPASGCLSAMRDRARYETGAAAAGEKESCAAGGDAPWARVAFAATVSRRMSGDRTVFVADVAEQLSAPAGEESGGGGGASGVNPAAAKRRRAEDLAAQGGRCSGRGRRSLVRPEEMEMERQRIGANEKRDGAPAVPLGLHRVLRSELEVECRGGSAAWTDSGGAGTACGETLGLEFGYGMQDDL